MSECWCERPKLRALCARRAEPDTGFDENTVRASGPPHTLALSPAHAMLHAESATTAPPPLTNALPQ